jgi:XTP/dITP diphosphohydrolase
MSTRLVLASNNAKKAAEMQALLAPLGIEVIPQSVFGVGEAEEPHPSFVENALAKARHAAAATGLPAVADDSGLCVEALGGAPGVISARFAGESELVAEGEVAGVIAAEPRGSGGFGYDPVFVPVEGDGATFAELTPEAKHRISHRGRALAALVAALG